MLGCVVVCGECGLRATGSKEARPATPRVARREEVVAGSAVRAIGSALGRPVEKLNLGALGNITPQLHAHVVGRRADDAAWPGPVWGVGVAVPYEALALERVAAAGESSEREEACRDRLVRGEGTWLAMGEVTWGTTPDTRGSFTCRKKNKLHYALYKS